MFMLFEGNLAFIIIMCVCFLPYLFCWSILVIAYNGLVIILAMLD